MRVLFVAYCMVDNENGDSLIGVYKRSIRIGLEMVRRGHEVWIVCAGRRLYHDDLTRLAETHFHFADLPEKSTVSINVRRRYTRMLFRRIAPDMVVGGEAPLAGPILEATLCAVSLHIPVVVLDNAYSPECSERFVAVHGPMLDGIVLTGPSSCQMENPPGYYCPVPPYIEGSEEDAGALLDQLGLSDQNLVTVLGYEKKAEHLAAALLPTLTRRGCAVVFLAPKPHETQERLHSLPANLLKNTRVLPLPSENLLFGLLKISKLVIGKCGFMQVSECLALRTPFLGIQYRGCFPLQFLPRAARPFVFGTHKTHATWKTQRATARLLGTSPDELCHLHDGSFGARSAVADFLERLPSTPRGQTTEECLRLGYPAAMFLEVLSKRHPDATVSIDSVRCTRLRDMQWGYIDSVVCSYTIKSQRKAIFLWARRYKSRWVAKRDLFLAGLPTSGRRVLFVSRDGLSMLEEDMGELVLPTIPLGATVLRKRTLLRTAP